MSEGLLTVLKFCFLALLYLFLFRVVRVVLQELKAAKIPVPAPEPVAVAVPVSAPPRRERRERSGPQVRIIEPVARRGEVFPLEDEVTVGRAAGCGVVLADDTFVSQVHARLFRRGGDTFVEDLGSTNGTLMNGERITEVTRLRRGDRVQFGGTVVEIAK